GDRFAPRSTRRQNGRPARPGCLADRDRVAGGGDRTGPRASRAPRYRGPGTARRGRPALPPRPQAQPAPPRPRLTGQARIRARLRRQGARLTSGRAHRGRLAMSTVKRTPPARRAAAIGRWLTGSRSGGSRHRDVQGGTTRAAVLGAGDGLLTNLSLVLGVAGASTNASAVRLAGVAGLLAGAFSMAAGELVSVRAQQEMVDREVEGERGELAEGPEGERRGLAGMDPAQGPAAG